MDISGSRVGKEMVWRLSRSTRTKGSHSQHPKKLAILSSQVPVHWIVESWSRKAVEAPFTSMEILWIRNSCFKQFTLWIRSVFMRQQRIGVINSVWQIHGGTKRIGNVGISSELAWKQDARSREFPNIWRENTDDTMMWKRLIPEIATNFDLMVTTDGENTLLYREYLNYRSYPKTRALAAVPAGTIIGPIIEVHIVKILDEYGLEVAIPSICRNWALCERNS